MLSLRLPESKVMAHLPSRRCRQNLRIITIFLLALFASCNSESCPGRGTRKSGGPVRHFPLTVALSEPLGDAGTPLPDEIKAMFMPLEAKHCSGILFVPDVKVIRLDVQGALPEDLNFPQEQNAIQRAAGQVPNPNKARSTREEALKKQVITLLMAQPAGPATTTTENIRKLVAVPTNQRIFTFAGTQQALPNVLNPSKVTVATDTSDLLAQIGSTFCGRPGEKPPDQLPTYVVVYKPGTITGERLEARDATKSGTAADNNSTSPSGTATRSSEAQEAADALFSELSVEVQGALNDPARKRAVHARLATAQAEKSWDYRFTYERAKLAVYGTLKHDEAFYHLYRAAEIAIENGDAENMLNVLKRDLEENRPLHKLKHEHDKAEEEYQISTILKALETRDANLVRKLSSLHVSINFAA